MVASILQSRVTERSATVSGGMGTLHYLHVMPSFDFGGAQVRVAQIMNHLGPGYRHTVLAFDGRFGTRERVSPEIQLECRQAPRGSDAMRTVIGFVSLLKDMRPDLVLTYNWGAIEAALGAILAKTAPLVHGEDGFGPEEAQHQKRRRVLARRFVLRYADAVVAPSQNLMSIMSDIWKLPSRVTRYVPNGVDIKEFVPATRVSGTEFVVATVGQLRKEKCQDILIRACADLHRRTTVRLLIAGEGSERTKLETLAHELNFSEQVTFLGQRPNVAKILQQADLFALSSSTEQMPISVLEAMACGLPILSTAVGDVANMVSSENRAYICRAGQEYQDALGRLAQDSALRLALGAANRTRCVEIYSLGAMMETYKQLYGSCLRARVQPTS